jgi:hypothetical protein
MKFRDLWPYARTWWGLTVAIATALVALYQGPRLMLETWDWYCDRFRDNAVYFLMRRRKMVPRAPGIIGGIPREMVELPFYVAELAGYLNRKESSVQRSLKRLIRRGKVESYENGWHAK